jgi:hypothetical protein
VKPVGARGGILVIFRLAEREIGVCIAASGKPLSKCTPATVK